VLRLVPASVAVAKVASKAKLFEHVREDPVQLGCVQGTKQALKVSVHPCRQSVGQLPGTPDRDALAEAGGSEHVPNQSRELAHCPSEHWWFHWPEAAPRIPHVAKERRCTTRLCSAPRNVGCI